MVDRLHPSGLLYATYEHRLIAELDARRRPQHVAVLADGNRRWARANAPGQPLVAGYQAGADKLKEFVEWCDELAIPVVTLWVLSTDNFQRSEAEELGPLLKVIESTGHRPGGDRPLADPPGRGPRPAAARHRRGDEGRRRADRVSIDGMVVNVAVSYGGRHELRDAVRSLLAEHARNGTSIEEVSQTLDIEHIAEHLYTRGQPDPDLIIRTSGEQRLSGFLMWQSAHSEFYFCEALWPDFRKVDFIRALRSYADRERRFGG